MRSVMGSGRPSPASMERTSRFAKRSAARFRLSRRPRPTLSGCSRSDGLLTKACCRKNGSTSTTPPYSPSVDLYIALRPVPDPRAQPFSLGGRALFRGAAGKTPHKGDEGEKNEGSGADVCHAHSNATRCRRRKTPNEHREHQRKNED